MANIDLKKELKEFYQPSTKHFTEVNMPVMQYLAIDGLGDPNESESYRDAVESLYTTAYSIRAEWKKQTGNTFVVGPLEGLWWSEDPTAFTEARKSEWSWTMLISVPEAVSEEAIAAGAEQARKKKPTLPIDNVRRQTIDEGTCLQILHVGSYDDEAPVLASLHNDLMMQRGLTFNGPHHEVYLSDPRKVAPEKLRTILRQPVKPQ